LVARITTEGALDPDFGLGGVTFVDQDLYESLLMQPRDCGRGAFWRSTPGAGRVARRRLRPGRAGGPAPGVGASSSAAGLALDGGILLAATANGASGSDTVIARIEGGGALRPTLCAGRHPTLLGTLGADKLLGTDGPDVIMGLGGGDSVAGYGGNDLLCLGPGADPRHRGGPGADLLLVRRAEVPLDC
jgi:Ca2+-binding RTX toxin-like protein